MTSQRFLNDKVNSKDFLRSLKGACAGPVLAFLALCALYLRKVIVFALNVGKEITYTTLLKKHEIISYFGGALNTEYEYFEDTPIKILLVAFGVLTALMLFSFAFQKNSVNVYFSLGITRTRLYVNRVLAGIIEFFVATLLPFVIIFIINVSVFGYHQHQFALLAFNTLTMFASTVSGFIIGIFASTISGSIFEMLLTSASSSAIIVAFFGLAEELKQMFLKGYVVNYEMMERRLRLLTPWSAFASGKDFNNLVTGKKLPADMVVTVTNGYLPIIVWLSISIVLCTLGLYLFNKRKNENAHSFGKISIASALNGAMVFILAELLCVTVLYELYDVKIHSIALCVICCVLVTIIAFFVAELIMRRNLKAVKRMIPVCCGLLVCSFAVLLIIGTGYFGTFNKLPDIKDIEYVSMGYNDPFGNFNSIPNTNNPKAHDDKKSYFVNSSRAEDIKLCTEYFNKCKDKNNSGAYAVSYVEMVIKTKNGKFIAREFPVYSQELLYSYEKAVFNSEFFDDVIKMRLDEIGSNDLGYDEQYEIGYDGQYFDNNTIYLVDGSLVFNLDNLYVNDDEKPFEFTKELKTALYNDISKMTFDEYYGKKAEPLCAIATSFDEANLANRKYSAEYQWIDFYSNENYYSNGNEIASSLLCAGDFIPVYPQMTETLKVLDGIVSIGSDVKVKSVIYTDKKISLNDAVVTIHGQTPIRYDSTVFTSGYGNSYYGMYLAGEVIDRLFADKRTGTYIDFMEIVYNDSGVKLTRIDDAEKAKSIADVSRSAYDTFGDNGRYVYVIYEDGSLITKYLPEKSISILK